MDISSPCISLCEMDEDTRLCKGCWRTIEEIIAWSSHDDEEKKQVLALIEERKSSAITTTANVNEKNQ